MDGLRHEWAAVADVLTEGSALCSMWGTMARDDTATGGVSGDLLQVEVDSRDHISAGKQPWTSRLGSDPGFPLSPPDETSSGGGVANPRALSPLEGSLQQQRPPPPVAQLGLAPQLTTEPSMDISRFGTLLRRGTEGIRGQWHAGSVGGGAASEKAGEPENIAAGVKSVAPPASFSLGGRPIAFGEESRRVRNIFATAY